MTSDKANADRLHAMEVEFLEQHRDADLLVFDTKTGKVHEAVYHSMWKKISDAEKRFRDALHYIRDELRKGKGGHK